MFSFKLRKNSWKPYSVVRLNIDWHDISISYRAVQIRQYTLMGIAVIYILVYGQGHTQFMRRGLAVLSFNLPILTRQ